MNMKKLTTLLLTATLGLASGAALAADTGAQSNNGQANSSADAGQVAPDARENVAPNNVDNPANRIAVYQMSGPTNWAKK